jgi:hypothetical protein
MAPLIAIVHGRFSKTEIAMTKLLVPTAMTILAVLGSILVIASFRSGTPVAVLPPNGLTIEEVHHRVDVRSLPAVEIADLY